jgi:phage shock protein A
MGLFDRAFRVLRANLNGMVNQAEDPAKVLEQTLVDMEANLLQLRQAVAQAIATQKRIERQRDQAQATAQEWYNRAELGLRKGDEETARQALTRRQTTLEAAQAMEAQWEQQRQAVGAMKDNMHRLEIKIAEAKTKKDLYIARARSAEASQRLQEIIGGFSTGGAKAAFDQMEQRVLDLEARSEALKDRNGDSLERQFVALESGPTPVDQELEAMKARLGGVAPSPEGLPPAS